MTQHQPGSAPATAASRIFADRREAGHVLATQLSHHRGEPKLVVLGLPRGGVPVAYEVATALGASLDVFVVRKLGVPGHEELAMGAIASGGVLVLNDDVVAALRIRDDVIGQVAEREERELLRRERDLRGACTPLDVRGTTAILVDDGLATGSTMRAAIEALRRSEPQRVVVAVPTAPSSTCRELQTLVDEMVCATNPEPFYAVGQAYRNFEQTTDEEVGELLRAARARAPHAAHR
jgi:predicted phosphoribosyltransferase